MSFHAHYSIHLQPVVPCLWDRLSFSWTHNLSEAHVYIAKCIWCFFSWKLGNLCPPPISSSVKSWLRISDWNQRWSTSSWSDSWRESAASWRQLTHRKMWREKTLSMVVMMFLLGKKLRWYEIVGLFDTFCACFCNFWPEIHEIFCQNLICFYRLRLSEDPAIMHCKTP